MKIKQVLIIVAALVIYANRVFCQYDPGVGQNGTRAMYKDSSAFVNWASACQVKRGFQDISNTALGLAGAGDSSMALGKAQTNGALSLGDGGWAICRFPFPVKNGPGPDFAVFENSFDDSFLELATVEVSSDGVNFKRFRAHSLTDTITQTGTFGYTDPVKLNNLAGKYRGGYGTPFDLQELAGLPGLDINRITHIKITDVVGSVNMAYASRDGYGNKINEPWPTPFPSGGFDLDAIGVIHQDNVVGLTDNDVDRRVSVYPNPLEEDQAATIVSETTISRILIYDALGRLVIGNYGESTTIKGLARGQYVLRVQTGRQVFIKPLIVR